MILRNYSTIRRTVPATRSYVGFGLGFGLIINGIHADVLSHEVSPNFKGSPNVTYQRTGSYNASYNDVAF